MLSVKITVIAPGQLRGALSVRYSGVPLILPGSCTWGRAGASATTCIQRCLEAGEQQGTVDRLPPLSRNQI